MLWVTMMTVTRSLSSRMRSSIRSVDCGSSAEHGSSISSTSGSTARARAMHRRCCWPPDRPPAGAVRRFLTSSHRPAPRSVRSTTSSRSALPPFTRLNFGPAQMLSAIDLVGNGLGRWNTMPTARRTATGSASLPYTSWSCSSTVPSARAPGTSSCIRLRERRKVDFPQPDGPMRAVTVFAGNASEMPSTTLWDPK